MTVAVIGHQLRFVLPELAAGQKTHPSGVQLPCVTCAAAGIDRLGLPRDGVTSPALCMPCWRGGRQRQTAQERAELRSALWEGLGDAPAPTCPVCESDLNQERNTLHSAHRDSSSQVAQKGCWLCTSAWLRQLREQFQTEEDTRQDDVNAEFERITQRAEAEKACAAASGWVERIRGQLAAYAVGGRTARSVDLLAGGLYLLHGAKSSTRGRTGSTGLVAAVMAVSSDYRSGRRSMPGRSQIAVLSNCSERAVSASWRRLEACGWSTEVVRGGRLNFIERMECGRANNRSVFDLKPVHHFTGEQLAPWRPVAVALLSELLTRATDVLQATEDERDELDGVTDGNGQPRDWADQVRRMQLHVEVQATIQAASLRSNYFTPSLGSQGKYLSSCSYLGFTTPEINFCSSVAQARPYGREEAGASRSSTRSGELVPSPRIDRPRTLEACVSSISSRLRRRPPAWAAWAYERAEQLVRLPGWEWLAVERR
ncbi:MAG: hypothetical protein H0T78_12450, partial [Longispora sp.]|nr:hypothetical protein [Longispora sp. (in: high G+C Gram-positive bacteria)]